jgi:hypothetical protein
MRKFLRWFPWRRKLLPPAPAAAEADASVAIAVPAVETAPVAPPAATPEPAVPAPPAVVAETEAITAELLPTEAVLVEAAPTAPTAVVAEPVWVTVEVPTTEAAVVSAEAPTTATISTAPAPTVVVESPPAPQGPAVSNPDPVIDPEDLKARAMARLAYFTPAGYAPYQTHAPRLIAPSRTTPSHVSAVLGTADELRGYFASPPAAPEPPRVITPPGVVAVAHPADLALYFLGRENDPRLPAELGGVFLREPELLARAITLRDEAIESWLSGAAPWNLADFHARGLALAGHPGTALLVCHNVARAFARGGAAIRWIKTSRNQGEYFDGARAYTARAIHPQGVLRADPFAAPSIFYLLFSASVFGATDSGDWARYFASAALAWYIASGHAKALARPAASFATQWMALVDSLVEPSPDPAARAWSFANAASFAELSVFGRSTDANRRAARIQLSGALFGLQKTSFVPPASAAWRVPAPAGAIVAHPATLETLDASGNQIASKDSTPLPPQATPSLDESVLQALDRAVPSARRTGARVQAICTVEESIACRFAFADWSDSTLQPMAELLTDAIGRNRLEHAARRQAAIRFVPLSKGGDFACEIDLGEGYRNWAVRKS